MCLIVVGWRSHPEFSLVAGANRDEFYERPSAPAQPWESHPGVLGGRDLRGGGTWLGVTRGGRFAAVTNHRDPLDARAAARSRGELTAGFLASDVPAATFAAQAHALRGAYNGFNLLVGDSEELWYVGSRDERGARRLAPGVYGLSNALLDTPWPKLAASRDRFAEALRQIDPEPHVLDLLADRTLAPDEQLPDTGVGLEWERALSSPFIATERYGTRSSTFVALERARLRFVEHNFGPGGERGEVRRFEF